MNILNIDYKNSKVINDMLTLSAIVFWEWFIKKDELINQLNKSISKVIYIDNKIVGYIICFIPGKFYRNDIWDISWCIDIDKTAYIKTIIINPLFQCQWFWDILLKEIINEIKNRNINKIFLHAWWGSPNNSSLRFFQKHWAKTIFVYKNKWFNDSLEKWWNCSKCWSPCTCESIEMIIDI